MQSTDITVTNIIKGIEKTPAAFIDLLNGGNIGKRLIKVNQI